MLTPPIRRLPRPRPPRGVSIVELMVGVTIGLFIVAGATLVTATQLGDNRRMLMGTQLQQDLRATLDIINRDLRRAGYWAAGFRQTWPQQGMAGLNNPYGGFTGSRSSIEYARSLDEPVRGGGRIGFDNGAIDSDEQIGFRLNTGAKTVEMLVGANNWQALTDANVMQVTQFDVAVVGQDVPAPCDAQCPAVGPNNCPLVVQVRTATVTITASAVHDPNVVRSASSNVRLRNDLVREACP